MGDLNMTETNITVEQLLVYRNFIKYPDLKKLTLGAFAGSTSEELNIYIDLYSMLLELYRRDITFNSPNVITSTIINLCAHMRSYYTIHHNVSTKFFIVYGDTFGYNKLFMPGYNSANDDKMFKNPFMMEKVHFNLNLLEILCPYLPGIYFISRPYESMTIIADIMHKEYDSKQIPSLILSRDPNCIQLTSYGAVLFFNNKKNGVIYYADKQYAINSYLLKLHNGTNCDNMFKIAGLSGDLLNILITLSSLRSRGIPALYPMNKAINIVKAAMERGSILNGLNTDPRFIYQGLFVGEECKIDIDSFSMRFKAIDLTTQYMAYQNDPMSKDTSYKKDLIDVEAVQAINNEYFRDNPIDLNRL